MRKMVYVPNLQNPVGFQTLVVRSNLPLESLIPAVKNIVKEMDPNLPITHVETMREVIADPHEPIAPGEAGAEVPLGGLGDGFTGVVQPAHVVEIRGLLGPREDPV